MGTPVVSLFHAGVPEAVSHGETGLLAPEGNIEMLAIALQTLLDDDALWNSMSRRAGEWVRERFDLAKQARSLESLYDVCIADYPRFRPISLSYFGSANGTRTPRIQAEHLDR